MDDPIYFEFDSAVMSKVLEYARDDDGDEMQNSNISIFSPTAYFSPLWINLGNHAFDETSNDKNF